MLSTRLALFTLIPAVDGTLFTLAAAGAFRDPVTSVTVGLTVIAGAGAWLSAREEFGAWSLPHRRRFLLLAAVSAGATLAAALLGAAVGARLSLAALPYAAAMALALLGLTVAGLRLPQPARLPLPAWALATGGLVEVALLWSP